MLTYIPPEVKISNFAQVVAEIQSHASQATADAQNISSGIDTINNNVDGVEGELQAASTLLTDLRTDVAALQSANTTGSSGVTSAINLLKASVEGGDSTLSVKSDSIIAALGNVSTELNNFAAANGADFAAVITALQNQTASLSSKSDELKVVSEAISSKLDTIVTNLTTFANANSQGISALDVNNSAGFANVVAAINALDVAGDNQAVVTAVNNTKAAIDTLKLQQATESLAKVQELQAIKDLIAASKDQSNLDTNALIATANDIIAEITGQRNALLSKIDEVMSSTAKTVKVDTEIVDALFESQIAKIPAGSLTFGAMISNQFAGSLEWSDDQGASWKTLAVGIGFDTKNLSLPGHDIGTYPEFWVKYPVGAYGQVVGSKEGAFDILVESANAPSASVLYTVTDNGSDPAFAPFGGSYTDTGEIDLGGLPIATNETRFLVVLEDSNGSGGDIGSFYSSLEDARERINAVGEFNVLGGFVSNTIGISVGSIE